MPKHNPLSVTDSGFFCICNSINFCFKLYKFGIVVHENAGYDEMYAYMNSGR